MYARFVEIWVLAVYLAGRTVCAQRGVQQAAALEPIPFENVEQGRHALQKWEEQATAEGGVMNIVFGNTCFTTAIAQMKQGCTKMDSTNRCWLAIQFTMCFQRASGLKGLDCPTVCSKYRRLQTCVEDCTAKMDSNSYTTYTHFYSDVFNMCLFLQTQNFQEFTTALVQDMHLSTVSANTTLGAIKTDLADQRQAVMQSLQALTGLKEVQLDVAAKVREGLSEVQKVSQMSLGLQHSMNTSLEMTDALSVHQLSLLAGFSNLSQLHRQHVEEAAAAWQQLKAGAAALEQRQVRYEALQAHLLNASEGLLGQQQGMSSLLEVLIHYQHTGSSLLNHLYTSSTTLQDIMFYIIALSIPLLFVTHPLEARLLLLLAVLVSWVTERSIIQQLVPIHHSFSGHSGTVGQHSASVAAAAAAGVFAGTPGHVHGAKMGVRFVVLGGCCGLVMWWVVKKELARRKKVEIFEDIRKSFAASDNFHRGYPAAPYHPPSAPPAAAQQHVPSHAAAIQHHHMINALAPAAATAGSSPATTARSTSRGRRDVTSHVKVQQMPPQSAAAVQYQPHRAEAASGTDHTHLPLITWVEKHNPVHAWFSSNHHAHPSLTEEQMQQQQQQEEDHYSPAAAGNGHFVSPQSPGILTQQQQQQFQGPMHYPAEMHAQYAVPAPGTVPTAAAAAGEDSEDAHAGQMQAQLQQQDGNNLTVMPRNTRRRSSSSTATPAATSGLGKSEAAHKKRKAAAAAAVDTIPEEGDAAAGAEDTVGHAAKRPAGRKTKGK